MNINASGSGIAEWLGVNMCGSTADALDEAAKNEGQENDEVNLAKAVRHMEKLQVRRLPVINKGRRMVGILSLGDVSNSAPGDLLSECVKSVSAHH